MDTDRIALPQKKFGVAAILVDPDADAD